MRKTSKLVAERLRRGSTAMRAMTMSSRAGWSGREARDDEAGTKRKDSGSFLRLI